MARFNIPAIVRKVDLSGYAAEYDELGLYMWVNPPRRVRHEFGEIRREMTEIADSLKEDELSDEELTARIEKLSEISGRLYAWWSAMWSKGPDPDLHVTPEEAKELAEQIADTDPDLWTYIQVESYRTMTEFHVAEKKAGRAPS